MKRANRLLPAAALLALSGCASGSISDPSSPSYNPSTTAIRETLNPTPALAPEPFVAAGARRSGVYPAYGTPRPAAEQISATEREILEAELAAAAAQQRNDPVAESRYRARVAELEALARTHGSQVRDEIEN